MEEDNHGPYRVVPYPKSSLPPPFFLSFYPSLSADFIYKQNVDSMVRGNLEKIALREGWGGGGEKKIEGKEDGDRGAARERRGKRRE